MSLLLSLLRADLRRIKFLREQREKWRAARRKAKSVVPAEGDVPQHPAATPPTDVRGQRSGPEAHALTEGGSTPPPAPTSRKVSRQELRAGQRAQERGMVAHVDPGAIPAGKLVKTPAGAIYGRRRDGALARVGKPVGTKKQRRRARAVQKAIAEKSVAEIQSEISSAAAATTEEA